MPDYSEFPTTPTAWQERAWQEIAPLPAEDPPVQPRPRIDLVALVPGVAFITIAILVLTGVDVPMTIFRDGGVLWALLIIAGVGLLLREVRRGRRR
ncbi:hypothetical protein [Petropleomorpha daqingensis]|uniref:Uncharacterized protein n=1 Tax=Petropleomorpha daqingensis TaxID=2026353 RepID=A0A853CC95_9ACTN|nr:hypothetical protein [Petropleomorpha daqingensis]NYJ04739.1 hypothetical protein [Petropleomorpha daqingensis]